ncbi:MAG: L-seryl-tRNA(Sec) selenium transferase, partial [Verrucomicrobia bacterium]|nr:L-seryl-tRNA(Sec) selenium transferase [Verrucomicrobiota bacterium]
MAGPRNNSRAIPGVDTILDAVTEGSLPRPLVVGVIRAELQSLRKAGSIPGHDEIVGAIRQRLDDLALSRLQPVINGTGVVVHTNLGRSPMESLATPGFVNLETDLR